MNKKHILTLGLLLGLSLALFAQVPLSKNAVGLHLGSQSGTGYSMRFFGPKQGLQVTLGALTWGNDNVYFPEKQYYWYDDDTEFGWSAGGYYYDGDLVPPDTLLTMTQKGRLDKINLGLNHILVLDTFNVFGYKDHGRLYLMTGGAYEFHRQTKFSKDYRWVEGDAENSPYFEKVDNSAPIQDSKPEHRWTAGLGLGVDIAISKNFRGALEFPITYNWDNRISYIPQIGIYYYFK